MRGRRREEGRVAMANFACQWDPSNRVNEKMPEAGEMALLFFPRRITEALLHYISSSFFFLSFVFSFFPFFLFFEKRSPVITVITDESGISRCNYFFE